MWFLAVMYAGPPPGLFPVLKQFAITWAGFILSSAGVRLLRAGKKARERPADELLMRDKRAPVLYLRSFCFDDVSAETTITSSAFGVPLATRLPEIKLSTYEGTLAGILKKIGPCIAVGLPGTTQQVLGFSRLELAEDKWQIAVKELMKEAALVLICSGESSGVRWELEQAAELVAPEKLVILITSNTMQDWWQMADGIFQKQLPRIESAGGDIFVGVVTFDRNGTPRGDQLVYYQKEQASIENSLNDAFKPIFIRLQASIDGD